MRGKYIRHPGILMLAILAATLLLNGCGTSGGDGTGTLDVRLVDSSLPGVDAVYVTIDRVDVHPQGGNWQTELTPHKTVNLLELINGLQQNLGLSTLNAGPYTQMRLVLGKTADDSLNIQGDPHPFANYLIDGFGLIHELKVPSGMQSGVKLVGGFTIAAGRTTILVLDFDAARSVVVAGASGQYLLKPTISVVSSAASVAGQVSDDSPVPLPGAQVIAQTTGPVSTDISASRIVATTLTDAAGNYRLFLTPDVYQLSAFLTGENGIAWNPVCHNLTLAADQVLTGEDFILNTVPSGTLSLSVSFTPIPADQHVRLSLRQAASAPCTLPLELVTLNLTDGAAIDLELPPGSYQVIASGDGLTTQTFDLGVTAGTTTTQAVSF